MSNRNITQPQYNNLVSGFDKYQRNYIQESSFSDSKYYPKNSSFAEFAPKTGDRYTSMEGFRDNSDNRHQQSEMEYLKKTIAEHETKFVEMRRDIEDMQSKFSMMKNTTQGNLHSNYEKRISDLELVVRSLQDQARRGSSLPVSSKVESFNEPVGTEVERKINELNESIREQLKVMDVNFVELLCEKDQTIGNLSKEISLMQSNINIIGDQMTKLERALARKVDEGQLYKLIEPHLSTRGDMSMSMRQSRQGFFEKDLDAKMKELETSFNKISLIEQDIRGKYELYDLNLNSIKKHMELDLTMSLKQSIVPIQKNIETYLQGVESRINYLEDVVTKEIKKDSFIFQPSNVRDQTYTRTANAYFPKSVSSSQNIKESMGFGVHLLDSQVETRFNEQRNIENLSPSHPNTQNSQNLNTQDMQHSPKADQPGGNLEHLHTHDSIRIEEDEINENMPTEPDEPSEGKIAKTLAQDKQPKDAGLSNAIRNVESYSSELPLLHDMPVPTKTTGAFKIIYQEHIRNQANEKTLKSAKEGQKIRSPGLREDSPQENQTGSRQQSRQAEEYDQPDKVITGSGARTNPSDSYGQDKPKNTGSVQQSKPLDQKVVEPPASNTKDVEIDEGENFEGNIKGLLKKARKMRESYPPKEEFQDFKSLNRYEPPTNSLLGVRGAFDSRPMFDPRLQAEEERGLGYGRDLHNRAYLNPNMDEIQEGDDVEEIVYHVNEEGYLVDEFGNFLYDEQGNFIRLSPEQMREIEENEVIYQEDDN